NLAFRRSAYLQIGGFTALPDTLVEDFALIQAVRRFTALKCRFYLIPESVVVSRPAETLPDLYFQRRRWSTGVRHAPPMGLLLMSIAFAAHAAPLFAFFRTPWAVALLVPKAVVDLLLIRRAQKAAQVAAPLRKFLAFEVYFIIYTLVLPFLMLLDRRIRWKDARYTIGRSA
ncbi:MAG: hypothetical protein ONB12_11240, partial [candidate division KSB1 bacterium]|nr:hypothetical protein [candidate division KSB1 bacterium]